MAAMKPSALTMIRKALASKSTRCALPERSDSTDSASTASFWCRTTIQATRPTTMVLMIALSSSTSALIDTMLPRPLIGLSFENLGMKALELNSHPPTSSGEASATAMTTSASGRQDSNTVPTSLPIRCSSTSASKIWSRFSDRPDTIAAERRRTTPSPKNHRQQPAAISTVNVATSRERGTSPSSRACSRRFSDAGSVFSASLSAAIDYSC